jgi:hypothetical protein
MQRTIWSSPRKLEPSQGHSMVVHLPLHPLVPPPPSPVTVGAPPPPLLPRLSPLPLAVCRATSWPAPSPPAPPLALKVVGSQFTGSSTGSGSPSAGSTASSCSRCQATTCHGRAGRRRWSLDVAPSPPDPVALAPTTAGSASPVTGRATTHPSPGLLGSSHRTPRLLGH